MLSWIFGGNAPAPAAATTIGTSTHSPQKKVESKKEPEVVKDPVLSDNLMMEIQKEFGAH